MFSVVRVSGIVVFHLLIFCFCFFKCYQEVPSFGFIHAFYISKIMQLHGSLVFTLNPPNLIIIISPDLISGLSHEVSLVFTAEISL